MIISINCGGKMKLFERVKKDSKFLMLLMLILALIALILFIIFAGFVLWFWILLVLWIAFFIKFVFLFAKFGFVLFCIGFVILFALSVIFMIVNRKGSTVSVSGPVPCTSPASASLTTEPGYKISLYSQNVDSSDTSDTGVRTFSIASLNAKTGPDLFYRLEKTDGGMVTGTRGLMEICDANNNESDKYEVTKDATTTPGSDTALAEIYYMHGNKRVNKPGTYRVDAYINVSGTWKLVGRIPEITITD
jgi:energy-coupling factor transporter transmembrane protein EcfT